MKHKTFAPSLAMIALLAGVVILAASSPARADGNKRCKTFASTFAKDYLKICAEVKTTVQPREAKSVVRIKFKPREDAAKRCRVTVWVIMYNKQGAKIGESSRKGAPCGPAQMTIGAPLTVEHKTPTGAYYARARGCVDLYFSSAHSVWQKCQESEKVGFNRN